MIVAAKLLIVTVCGAGRRFSKFGRHFANVIPPDGVQYALGCRRRRSSACTTAASPEDLRPSERGRRAWPMSGATFVEFVVPLILLFLAQPHGGRGRRGADGVLPPVSSSRRSRWRCRWSGTRCSSTVAAFLFLGHPNYDGFGLGDMDPALLAVTVAGLLFSSRCSGTCAPTLVLVPAVDAPVRR